MSRQTDLQMDKRGRITVPKNIRRQLNVADKAADVRVTIEVLEQHEADQ